ncbi:MAG TPA: hypothetical protein VH988_19625 [Thermoanaerobaculia bacterium]|jgi:hypothetical protein|nr:hypothetical protein [Thermoanaerobaculia bacterium]
MVTIKTIATVTEDGMITAKASGAVPRGRYRAVIVLDDIPLDKKLENQQGFPDMAAFRESLKVPTYPGNTILEMREDVSPKP